MNGTADCLKCRLMRCSFPFHYEHTLFKKLRILNSLSDTAIALLDNAIRYTKSLGFHVAKSVGGLAEVSSIFKKALGVLRSYFYADL